MVGIILVILKPLTDILGKFMVDPIKNQVSYLCCYSSNVQKLNDEVPELNTRKESVQQDVAAATDNLEVVRPEVVSWLSKVEEIQRKSTGICNDAAEVQKRCLSKWCPPLHYRLSREALKTTEASIKLRDTRFERVANPVNPADLEPIPATSEIRFKSRDSIENKIMDALKDDSVYLIGICGMGGIGKTTMAKEIEKRAREKTEDSESMFEKVVMVVMSQHLDLPKVQKQIAEALGLELRQESLTIRARLLHARLKAAKSILIILDGVWERLNLEELGIPSQSTHSQCKLVLTSRNRNALTLTEDAMIFPLEVLTGDESWILFRKNAGDSIDSSDLHQIAKDIVRECNGLPLALVTVGSALRGLRKSSWEDALLGLQQPIPTNIPEVLKDVYRSLLLSYNQLESEEYRYLFLLCCLFPEDSDISLEVLVGYGKGLGIFAGVENVRQARNRVERIVENLISRSLLLESDKQKRHWIDKQARDWMGNLWVKMHDVVRDIGIWIASEGNHVFMISHGKNEWPKPMEESYSNYSCISLIFSEYNMGVPERIKCPKLEFLRVDFPWASKVVLPKNFFGGMTGLKVLEVSGIQALPSSVHLLTNLRTLFLSNCELKLTSIIGELINLEILYFIHSNFEVLPKETRRLRKLRKLFIYHCWGLRRIAFGVLSGLVQLEELVIIRSFRDWEAEEKDKEMKNASLAELHSLSHLTTLHIELSDPNAIPKKMPLWEQKLTKYSITATKFLPSRSVSEYQKAIVLESNNVTPLGNWIYDMAGDAEYLSLDGSICMNVVNRLIPSGYQNLKYFMLNNCIDMQLLGHALAEGQQNAIFPILKRLEIFNSHSLQEISNGPFPTGSFEALEEIRLRQLSGLVRLWTFPGEKLCLTNLKVIEIRHCKSLLYLFPLSMAESLSQLEELKVFDCQVMEEIFNKEDGRMETTINMIKLPRLWYLGLEHLPSLCSFCKGIDGIEVPALHNLIIGDLPSTMREGDHEVHQQRLFDQRVASNSLKLCILTSLGNFNFNVLQTLKVESLHNFKSLLSPSILSGLRTLKELDIKNCSTLEKVIGKEENVGETKTQRIMFLQLKTLRLSGLPKFLAFCQSMGDFELPSLQELYIEDCPMMETFVQGLANVPIERIGSGISDSKHIIQHFFTKQVLCTKLKILQLDNLNIAGIFRDSNPNDFSGLEVMSVKSCHRMSTIFSPPIFRCLTNIKRLNLTDCEELQEVIAKEDEEGPTNTKEILSPQLKYLNFRRLPKMRRFCHITNDLELPSLEEVRFYDCPMLEIFSPGPLLLPSLKHLYGLPDPDFATKFFFKKEKSSDRIQLENNCFTLSATDLSFDRGGWTIDREYIDKVSGFLVRDSSDSFVIAVRLPRTMSLEITGKFETGKLRPGVVYEIIFMIMLEERGFGWEEPVNLKLTLPEGIEQHHTEILEEKPRDEWIEILVGEFKREPHQIGQLEFSLDYKGIRRQKFGLIIKGVKIQVKG